MPRFFYPQPIELGTLITLPDAVAHHIQVLRLNVGDSITLFNGEGGEYSASLRLIEKKRVHAEVQAFSPREAELPYAITLAQALPESSKMDGIIEKAVELGVTNIQPLSAQRCVTRLSGERAQKRHAHWQGIIVAASEQSGRNRLAQLTELTDFQQWIRQKNTSPRILLTPRATLSLPAWARQQPAQAVTIMIGPEGGFNAAEEQAAHDQGVLLLSMGDRILRTETAGMAAVAGLSAVWIESPGI